MPFSLDTVKYVAHLARIELKAQELEIISNQLQDIVAFIDMLREVDINAINPTSHILPLQNVLREDTLVESLPIEKALGNAPERKGSFFGVPKVIE
ncbi:MAG: Asp-tRNA(Asn)/Glu-tRNA(Gln) amidotransferase subunit GatC [Candidatus Omnitrophota bacterium]|jgi:aspartyl-tRNA(Asn)/glutamyl-tRNA(Gln) amidotransferase subunit C